jgi:hypothetical protein
MLEPPFERRRRRTAARRLRAPSDGGGFKAQSVRCKRDQEVKRAAPAVAALGKLACTSPTPPS